VIGDETPANVEAERGFLEACLFDRAAIDHGIDLGLAESDFYKPENGKVWAAILSLTDARRPVDMVTVTGWLIENSDLEAPGSLLASLSGGISANAPYYGQVVKEKAIRRDLIDAASSIATLGYNQNIDIETMLDKAESVLKRTAAKSPNTSRDPSPADIIARLEGEKSAGLPTRFPGLNAITTGMVRGHIWVIGGFSSTGKSAAAVNLTEDAIRAGGSVMIASTEMSQEQYLLRLLSLSSSVPQRTIRHGGMTIEEMASYSVARDYWKSARIRIFDDLYSTARIRRYAKKVKEQIGLDVLIVDFIQNLTESGDGDEVKSARIASIQLQALAKELNCCVIALSQISNAQAMMQQENGSFSGGYYSFKGSGAIKDVADCAIMLDRDRVNSPEILWWNVVKNRHDTLARLATRLTLATGSMRQLSDEEAAQNDPNAGRRSKRKQADD